jgi:HipA-like protein
LSGGLRAWEFVFAELARKAGIDVADTALLTLGERGRTFVTRRFDRSGAGRRLFASAMTMTGKVDGEPAGHPEPRVPAPARGVAARARV